MTSTILNYRTANIRREERTTIVTMGSPGIEKGAVEQGSNVSILSREGEREGCAVYPVRIYVNVGAVRFNDMLHN